jgi:hypothetical protein
VTIQGRQADGDIANVLHFDMSTATGPTADMAKAVLEGWIATILPELTDTTKIDGAHWIDLSSSSGDTGDVTPDSGDVTSGGVHVQPCPPQVAYLLKLVTLSERGVRNGRVYLPGVRMDEVDEHGDVSSTTRGNITGAGESFRDGVIAGPGLVWSVLHNPAGGPTAMTPVAATICEVPVATQKRRLNR